MCERTLLFRSACLTVAVFTFAACSKTETIEIAEPITFSAIQENRITTKGKEVNARNFATDGNSFVVWGFINGTTHYLPMVEHPSANGLAVSYSSAGSTNSAYGWGYDGDPYYWPATSASLDFYAIWPANDASIEPSIEGSSNTFNYHASRTLTNQVDVMTAATTASSSPVQLKFHHALSQICFTARTGSPDLTVNISKIRLHNILSGYGGKFTINSDGTASYDKDGNKKYTGSEQIYYYNADIKEKGFSTSSTVAEAVEDNDVLLLIPQELSTGSVGIGDITTQDDTSPFIEISYTLTDNAHGNKLKDATVYYKLTGSWTSGTKYTYALAFGADKVSFSVNSIEDWASVEGM